MNNIKNIYQHAGKCDDQQNLNYVIDAAILSTPEGFIDKSPNLHLSIFLFFLSFYLSIPHSKKKNLFFFHSIVFLHLFSFFYLSVYFFPYFFPFLIFGQDLGGRVGYSGVVVTV